jgi:hypothetical protein
LEEVMDLSQDRLCNDDSVEIRDSEIYTFNMHCLFMTVKKIYTQQTENVSQFLSAYISISTDVSEL